MKTFRHAAFGVFSLLLLVSCSETFKEDSIREYNLFFCIASFAGGIFGAAISGNMAFGFTGFLILIGIPVAMITGNTVIIDYVAFGPVFGPHISFAGGVAAAAYAAKKKMIASGREISLPLAGLNAPDVLLVGGIFGVMGYIIVEFTKRIPVLGSNTDNIALTVLILGILVRVIFGVKNKKVFNTDFRVDKKTGRCWLPFQSTIPQVFIISLSSAILAASMAVAIHFNLGTNEGDIEGSSWSILLYNVHILPFAISALCIFFVAMGYKFPVTHHVTITSALAAWMFYPIVGHHIYFAVFLGTVMGVFSGLMCEFFARLFYIDGDTHIDPPASIIWISTTITLMSVKLIEGVAL